MDNNETTPTSADNNETTTPEKNAATEGEVGLAGNVTELRPVEETPVARDPLALQRHAVASRLMAEHGNLIARPVSEWGLLGEGTQIDGHMLLIDVDTLEKVRAYPGATVPAGRVFCNGRNLPTEVVEGL